MKKSLFVLLLNLIVIVGLIIAPLPLVSDVSSNDQLSAPADRSERVNSDRVATPTDRSLSSRLASPAITAQPVTATPSTASQPAPSPLIDLAYIKNIDLGAGQRAALVASSPINYRASDGSWQPIDPRFEVAADGFMSKRNSLVIGAAQQQAVLQLVNGQNAITWMPQALLAASADRHEAVIASSLPLEQSAPGTLTHNDLTIMYPHSWTLPDLSTEVTAGAGRVEQSLIGVEGDATLAPAPNPPLSDHPHTHEAWLARGKGAARQQYSEKDIPAYWAYARQFTVCDHYFTDVAGPSTPNHLMLIAAASPIVNNPHSSDPPNLRPPYKLPSLPASLTKAGLSWRNYGGYAFEYITFTQKPVPPPLLKSIHAR